MDKYDKSVVSEQRDRVDIDPRMIARVHESLQGFDKYNVELPFYVEKPFSDDQVSRLRKIFDDAKRRNSEYKKVPNVLEYNGESRFDPKKVVHMSREMIEFVCPEDIIAVMDSYALPAYKDPITLVHYNYIDYNLKYGDGKYAPSLPPHVDADENLVTFNYMLDGNIDWEVYIGDKPYQLKTGDAIVFSAVNQVHWRPKRKWKEGEFVEIISFDYCPLDSYRLTGKINPLDPFLFPEKRLNYFKELRERPEFELAWKIYNDMGLEAGIPKNELAGFEEERN